MALSIGRFIPAWAGNSRMRGPTPPETTVHPRVGGEQHFDALHELPQFGSSPRGRGTVDTPLCRVSLARFIPAWAGNRWVRCACPEIGPVHPRVGGEQCHPSRHLARAGGSSPRGRGTALLTEPAITGLRFIPAWAGNSKISTTAAETTPVHPRVGGEQLSALKAA